MRRWKVTASVIATLTAVLVVVPLTAGGQEDGRAPGTPAPEAPLPEASADVNNSGGWDGDGPAPRVLHAANVTIDGSACVGNDCNTDPPVPNYGFDTIRLMENNLRIMFVDTSAAAAFPRNDWQLVANQSSNGGTNYFALRDCGSSNTGGSSECGTRLFTVEAGADNDSIYVEDTGNQGGNVGLGTANPGLDLDILSGNTPAVRLQQDGSSGFTAQSWDLAGNEASFFIRDVTNGSSLPFRIEPGTASSTLHLASDENVGMGTANPERNLHIRSSAEPEIRFESTSDGQEWDVGLDAAERFVIRDVTGSFNALVIDDATHQFSMFGDALVSGNLTVGSCTGCGVPSDAAIKRAFSPVDAGQVLQAVGELPISTWSYSADDPWVRHIGPTAQDFAAAFGVGSSNRVIEPVDMNGVALTAIQALLDENAAQDALIAQLNARLAALEAAAD